MIIEWKMTKNPITCNPEMSLSDAEKLMKTSHVSQLPVLDKHQKLVGIITQKDLLHASPSPATTLSIHEMAYLLSRLTVSKIMTKKVITIPKSITTEEAAMMMIDQGLSCLPVMEGDKLIGILTMTDMFKILLELFGAREFGIRVSFSVNDKVGAIAQISTALQEHNIDIITMNTLHNEPGNYIITLKLPGTTKTEVIDILKPIVSNIFNVKEV